jgi:hypothetical protein
VGEVTRPEQPAEIRRDLVVEVIFVRECADARCRILRVERGVRAQSLELLDDRGRVVEGAAFDLEDG